MSQSSASDFAKILEELTDKRNKLAERLKDQSEQLENIRKKKVAIQNLFDNLKKSQREQMLKLEELTNVESQKMKETKEKFSNVISILKNEIFTYQGPLNEEKANYQMVAERLNFVVERSEEHKANISRRISQNRYQLNLVKAKMRETNQRIVALRSYLQESNPELTNEEISNANTLEAIKLSNRKLLVETDEKQKEVNKLEKICRQLTDQKKLLEDQIKMRHQ